MTIIDLCGVLYTRRILLIAVFLLIVATGMSVTLLIGPSYESTMKILITRDRIDPQVTPTDRAADGSRADLTEEEFNSEIEILRSRAVIESTVRQLGLDKEYAPGQSRQGSFARLRAKFSKTYSSFHGQSVPDAVERAVADLIARIEVVAVKKSRIIKVTCKDSSPERAALILEEIYRQFSEYHLRLLQSPKAANVFREQSRSFEEKLNRATTTLKRFDAENGLAANTSQRDILLRQLYDAEGQYDKTITEIREAEERIGALKIQLASQPERIESEIRTKYVSALDKIKDEILSLDLQRTQLLQKYKPDQRMVKDVEARLAQARELLAREQQAPPREMTTVINEIRQRLTVEMLSAEANLVSLRERGQRLGSLLARYRSQMAMVDQKSLERADLERIRSVNEQAFLLYNKKAQEADIVDALNEERVLNFSIAEPPGIDHVQVSPRPMLNLAALSVVGLAASAAIVAIKEHRKLKPVPSSSLSRIGEDEREENGEIVLKKLRGISQA